MRTLLAKDIAPFTKILAKMELKESVKNMFGKKKQDGEMASEIIWGLVENFHKAEQEFFTFLGGLEGKSADEIGELPLPDFINIVTEFISEKNFPFFKSAAK